MDAIKYSSAKNGNSRVMISGEEDEGAKPS